jgi:hypothetical protein
MTCSSARSESLLQDQPQSLTPNSMARSPHHRLVFGSTFPSHDTRTRHDSGGQTRHPSPYYQSITDAGTRGNDNTSRVFVFPHGMPMTFHIPPSHTDQTIEILIASALQCPHLNANDQNSELSAGDSATFRVQTVSSSVILQKLSSNIPRISRT